MIVYRKNLFEGWKPTRFRSLASVKRWATRYHHAYELRNDVLRVSTAEGDVYEYRARTASVEMETR